MNNSTRLTLQDYVEKALKLKRFDFDNHVRETGLGFYIDENWITHFDLPNEKERDALLLTFRLFIQENDSISFPKLKNIIEEPGISDEYKTRVAEIYDAYSKYKDGHPENIKPGFFEEGKHPTRDEILKVVLYGDLAHTNERKRETFQLWARDEIRKSVLLQVFTRTVINILKFIYLVGELSETELSKNAG